MSAVPASTCTIWLIVLCSLATTSGIEIDGKLGKPVFPSEVPSTDAPEHRSPESLIPYVTETSAGTANPCPPNTRCLLLGLALSPSTQLISLVPVVKGKPAPLVPVVKGKPVLPKLPPVHSVPVIKGKPVVPRVSLVPVVIGRPVLRKPFQRNRPRTKPQCCFVVRRYYDHLGHPCYHGFYPIRMTKPAPWSRPTASTDRIYPAGIYPTRRYPAVNNPSGYYPVGSYPTRSYPATHQPGGRVDWPRPSRPPNGGVGHAPWTPLVTPTRSVIKVDGKLGFAAEEERDTADKRPDVKLDGRLGAFV